MLACAKCGEELPAKARFCLVCGEAVAEERPAPEGGGSVSLADSVINRSTIDARTQDGSARIGGSVHVNPNINVVLPTAQATPPAQTVPTVALCELCGLRIKGEDYFHCLKCGRGPLCLEHFVRQHRCCDECAPAPEPQPADVAPPSPPEPVRPPLALPEGCRWVVEPAPACPADDARAYRSWVTAHGPVMVRHEATGIELVWVPGGSFIMGSADGDGDEVPVHRVELAGYWLGRTPVTVAQWRPMMGAPAGKSNDQGEDHPVVEVSWDDCTEYCRRAGLKLLTEAQWEYAARGPEGRVYPWGTEWDKSLCRSYEDWHGHERTAPVGSFPGGASWCGALDMAGNVWEWCRDWYQGDFYATPEVAQSDPECTNNSSNDRVLRGGGWDGFAYDCRSAIRLRYGPGDRYDNLGFRVSQDTR